jgi:predicted small integral membrane protein
LPYFHIEGSIIMLRIMKILLVLSVAMWGLLSAFGNIADWSGTTGAVAAVTSMATFEGGAHNWRATTNPAVIIAGALFIMLSKTIAGLLCLAGAWRMWAAREGDTVVFAKAKTFALTGFAVAIFMLFSGFIVMAEGWFELWRSDVMREPVLGSAFRYGGMIALIALFVGTRDD